MVEHTAADTQTSVDATHLSRVVDGNEITSQFNMHSDKFAQLGTAEDFSSLQSDLIPIHIQPVLESLNADGYFEITVPMVGLTDFMSNDPSITQMPQQFPTPIAMNGFGASSEESHEAYPLPYFVMGKDIAGNEYELMVSKHGQIEAPQDGTGMFSILSSMTYVFSADQVLHGQGLENLANVGAKEGYLYLLPPPLSDAPFTATVTASHLDDHFQRQVDAESKVPIVFEDSHGLLQNQDSMDSSGLMSMSDFGKLALIRNVFSEYDLTKSMLAGESFGIEHQNRYNDFQLSPEATGPYYDLLLSSVIQGHLPAEYIFQHVPQERWADLDLSYADLDSYDQMVLSELSILESPLGPHESQFIDVSSMPMMPESFETHMRGNMVGGIELDPGHAPTMIHYSDVIDISQTADLIKGFDVNHDKINLSDLLKNLPGTSLEDVLIDTQGSDVHISIQTQGMNIPVATLVGAGTSDLPDDLTQIFIRENF